MTGRSSNSFVETVEGSKVSRVRSQLRNGTRDLRYNSKHTEVTYMIARANKCLFVRAVCVSTAKVLTMKLVWVTLTAAEVAHVDQHRNWEPWFHERTAGLHSNE